MQLKAIFKNLLPRSLLINHYKKRRTPRQTLKFEVHLAEHCNLNCSGCNNFSPLAKPEFMDIPGYINDLKRLNEIFGDRIEQVGLLGGEPLLNPDVAEIMAITRTNLPKADISIVTNGLLLPKQNDEFWEACVKYNIKLFVTKYPVKFDFDSIYKLAEEKGVELTLFGNTDKEEKSFLRVPFDLEGKQDKELSYVMCNRANGCIVLNKGRLYTCTTVAHIRHFGEYFAKELEVTEEDSIDIYKENDADAILKRLAEPIDFCRYCMVKDKVEHIKWGVSKKNLDEWI